jgi:hypothetical protein
MTSWADFERAAPELAARVRSRLESGSHCLLGSLRSDGFPRISGVIPTFRDGELWLAMPESLKAADLRRDDRMSLHSAAATSPAGEGDAKLHGRARGITGPAHEAFAVALPHDPGPGGLAVFRIDLLDASLVRLNDARDAHVIESWQAGTERTTVRQS